MTQPIESDSSDEYVVPEIYNIIYVRKVPEYIHKAPDITYIDIDSGIYTNK
jgi:hypothetical protein